MIGGHAVGRAFQAGMAGGATQQMLFELEFALRNEGVIEKAKRQIEGLAASTYDYMLSNQVTFNLMDRLGIQTAKQFTSVLYGIGAAAGLVTVALAAVGGGAIALTRQVMSATSFYENAIYSFTQLLGSLSAAQARMKWLRELAWWSPFPMTDLIEASQMLDRLGLKSETYLRAAGDAAASLRKPLMDAVLAIAGASRGQMERMILFGESAASIEAELGHKINRKTVEGQREVADAVKKIWEEKHGGMMKTMASSWDSLMAGIKDKWRDFLVLVGQAGVFDVVKSDLNKILEQVLDMFETGRVDEWAKTVSNDLISIYQLLKTLGTEGVKAGGGMVHTLEAYANTLQYWKDLAKTKDLNIFEKLGTATQQQLLLFNMSQLKDLLDSNVISLETYNKALANNKTAMAGLWQGGLPWHITEKKWLDDIRAYMDTLGSLEEKQNYLRTMWNVGAFDSWEEYYAEMKRVRDTNTDAAVTAQKAEQEAAALTAAELKKARKEREDELQAIKENIDLEIKLAEARGLSTVALKIDQQVAEYELQIFKARGQLTDQYSAALINQIHILEQLRDVAKGIPQPIPGAPPGYRGVVGTGKPEVVNESPLYGLQVMPETTDAEQARQDLMLKYLEMEQAFLEEKRKLYSEADAQLLADAYSTLQSRYGTELTYIEMLQRAYGDMGLKGQLAYALMGAAAKGYMAFVSVTTQLLVQKHTSLNNAMVAGAKAAYHAILAAFLEGEAAKLAVKAAEAGWDALGALYAGIMGNPLGWAAAAGYGQLAAKYAAGAAALGGMAIAEEGRYQREQARAQAEAYGGGEGAYAGARGGGGELETTLAAKPINLVIVTNMYWMGTSYFGDEAVDNIADRLIPRIQDALDTGLLHIAA